MERDRSATFENPCVPREKPGVFPLKRVLLGEPNMSAPRSFVKRVNTTYCAPVLGQSQDIDTGADL
jgi:hypothetical protein